MKDDQARTSFNYKLYSGWHKEGGGMGYIIITRTASVMFSTFFSAIVFQESWLTPVTEPARVIQTPIFNAKAGIIPYYTYWKDQNLQGVSPSVHCIFERCEEVFLIQHHIWCTNEYLQH